MAYYEKRPSGWTVRFKIKGFYENKTLRLSGFKTKKDAEKAYFEYINDKQTKSSSKITLDKAFNEVLKMIETNNKTSTISNFYSSYITKIKPYINTNKEVSKITPLDILDWYNKINEMNFAYNTKIKAYSALNRILKYCETYYDIKVPLKEKLKFKKEIKKEELNIYTPEEFKIFISQLDSTDIYRIFFELLFYSGMRTGEALALTPNDLLDGNIINIDKSIMQSTRKATTPKNQSSIRKIEINESLFNKLKIIAFFKNENERLFPFSHNAPTIVNKKIAEKAKLHRIRLHDFRHSHASILVSSGVPITAVAKRLGHAKIEMTLNVYSHCLPNDNEKIRSVLKNL